MRVQKHEPTYKTSPFVVQLLKSWEYKNIEGPKDGEYRVVQLLKSWEYKNWQDVRWDYGSVVQLLKSWEYKNLKSSFLVFVLQHDYTIKSVVIS